MAQSTQSVLDRINSVHGFFDAQFLEIGNIEKNLLYSANELRPFSILMAKPRADRAKIISGKMQYYCAGDSLFNELGLYFHGEQRLYTDKSIYTPKLMRSMFFPSIKSTEEMADLLSSRTIQMARTEKTNFNYSEMMIGVYPLKGSAIPMSLVYFIDAARFQQQLSMIMPEAGSNMILLDLAGNILFEYDPLSKQAQSEMLAIIGNPIDSEELPLESGQNYLYLRPSVTANHRYVFVISKQGMLSQMHITQMLYTTGVLILILVEGLVLYGVLKLIYRPIHRLSGYSDSIVDPVPPISNDFDRIRIAIDYLMNQNTMLLTRVNENYASAKNHLIYQLINGEISSVEEFNQLGSSYNIAITQPVHWIVTLLLDMQEVKNTTAFRAGLVSMAENNLPKGLGGYGAFMADDKRVILLLFKDSEENFPNLFERLYQDLRTIFKIGVTAGISNAIMSRGDYPTAYIQSTAAARYSFVTGRDTILYYSDVVCIRQSAQYPQMDVRGLRSAIRLGDIEKIDELCERLYDAIAKSSDYMETARRLCYDVVEIADNYAYEHAEKIMPTKEYASDIFQLERFSTAREFVMFIRTICIQCCEIYHQPAVERIQLIEQVKRYIDINYSDPDFTVQEVADYFKLSVSNLSHLFKSKTNETVQNYLIKKRVDLAKALLVSGKSSEEVSKALGYLNTSSFMRTFKRVTGITPGEYRRSQCNDNRQT